MQLVELSRKDEDLTASHSVEEARERHSTKMAARNSREAKRAAH